jgi:hypothetical protein
MWEPSHWKADDMIEINGTNYRRFIPYPQPVTDGTVRCFFCGQIDEPQWHVDEDCKEVQRLKNHPGRSVTPPTMRSEKD